MNIEEDKDIRTVENEIELYLHCSLCMEERPANITPMDWSRTQSGWTKQGLQVWCTRHHANILHVDFEGTKHPGETGR